MRIAHAVMPVLVGSYGVLLSPCGCISRAHASKVHTYTSSRTCTWRNQDCRSRRYSCSCRTRIHYPRDSSMGSKRYQREPTIHMSWHWPEDKGSVLPWDWARQSSLYNLTCWQKTNQS